MIHIRVITQQSVLIIFLISNSLNPLLALPTKAPISKKRNQKTVNVFQEIQNILVEKGLDNDAALEKTKKLLYTKQNTIEKLQYLNSGKLHIPQKELLETLAKYALYEKELNLNSYGDLLSFYQNILNRSLNHEEKEYIENIFI